MPQPVLVIVGDNGFLGHHLLQHFARLGYRVVVISRSPAAEPAAGQWDARTLGS